MPYADPTRRAAVRHAYEQRNPGRRRGSRNAARAETRAAHEVTFVAVDGEGVDRPDGGHDYVLLSIGDESLWHADGRRLGTDEIFGFLWEQWTEQPSAAFVGFYLGYDFAHWLRDLPEERARMLLLDEGMAARRPNPSSLRARNPVPFPVRWGRWEFDLLPNLKRFKLRLEGSGTSWLYVCDAGGMFQTSFLRAIDPADWTDPVCEPAEYDRIAEGKAARGVIVPAGERVDPTMRAYNVTENALLSRLMARQNAGLVEMGVKLTRTQWHGPGQAAQAWLKATAPGHVGAACLDAGERDAFDAARRSYFGGWFEILAHGPVPGETFEYDINSAYPSVIAGLPCLLHGTWVHEPAGRPARIASHRLVYASVRGSDPFLGAMTHRIVSGAVLRPHRTRGWFWQHELEAARRAGLVDRVRWHEAWRYEPCDCAPPFRAIRDLYTVRLRAGKRTPLGKAAKLVYNSTYGKMAQSIGDPVFGNPVYASLITAGCRTMILEAIASHPERSAAVVMIATDGVYFRSPHPSLDIDPARLGAWDAGVKHNLSLFKPGVYWDDAARKAVKAGGRLDLKSRGVNARALAGEIARIDRQWRRFDPDKQRPEPKADMERWPAIDLVAPFAMISPRQALRRGSWNLNAVVEHDKSTRQSSAPHRKRVPRAPEGVADGLIRSRPWDFGETIDSVPYDKSFGMALTEGEIVGEIITPDGDYSMLVRELFGLG
jgi:hypothetical protein